MNTTQAPAELITRPKRADARRNYEKVLAAASEAFADGGEATSLEEIARRAGVGIGTLYRHFPNRQALVEALYVNEVEELSRSAEQLEQLDPWEALSSWFERLMGYLATKRVLAAELTNYLDPDAPLFQTCRGALFAAGEPLLKRAQDAQLVRDDVDFSDVLHMVVGISKLPISDPEQVEHIIRIALDGLRYRPDSPTSSSTIAGRNRRISLRPKAPSPASPTTA
jgi:AcrR family transcriptional regulator